MLNVRCKMNISCLIKFDTIMNTCEKSEFRYLRETLYEIHHAETIKMSEVYRE